MTPRRESRENMKPTSFAALAFSATLLVAACGSSVAKPTPTASSPVTQEALRRLLTVDDVLEVTSLPVKFTGVQDFRAMAASADPAQVREIDSWLGLGFQQTDGDQWISLTVVEFETFEAASTYYDRVRADDGLEIVEEIAGVASAAAEPNAQGIGAMVAFLKGDKVVTLHSVMPLGQVNTLVDLQGLIRLARAVERRL